MSLDILFYDCLFHWLHCDQIDLRDHWEATVKSSVGRSVTEPTPPRPGPVPVHSKHEVLRRSWGLCFAFLWEFSGVAGEVKPSQYYLLFTLAFCFEIPFQLCSPVFFLLLLFLLQIRGTTFYSLAHHAFLAWGLWNLSFNPVGISRVWASQ